MTVEMTADDIQKVYAKGLKQQNAGQFDAAIKTYGTIIAASFGSAASRAASVSCTRSVRSASSAEYSAAISIGTSAKEMRLAPLPVTNVVAVVIIALTFIPILAAYWLTRADEPVQR